MLAAADSKAPNWGCVNKENEDKRNGKRGGGEAAGGMVREEKKERQLSNVH